MKKLCSKIIKTLINEQTDQFITEKQLICFITLAKLKYFIPYTIKLYC